MRTQVMVSAAEGMKEETVLRKVPLASTIADLASIRRAAYPPAAVAPLVLAIAPVVAAQHDSYDCA